MFKLVSKFKPTGDQPRAIKSLAKNLKNKEKHQILLGVTGSGKTFTLANVIEKMQKPTLIISHNKTLAAQLYQEFKDFFPEAAVHYFVSYYDYYQPEAYLPQTDTYIEKDAKINEELDKLRHEAVQDLLIRKDIIIVASVSCIYNIGSPENYRKISLEIKPGQKISQKLFINNLTALQYQRNDLDFKPGSFRVRANMIDIYLVTGKKILRIFFEKEAIDKILISKNPSLSPDFKSYNLQFKIFPAHFWLGPQDKLNISLANIKSELQGQLKKLTKQKKLVEAQRLESKTNYDLEMLQETGFCHGIENYSRHLEFRKPKEPPYTLIDYFPKDLLIFIDESHMTLPQIQAMANQDKARKKTLIDYGFRLPSALDNRPLTFKEFEDKINRVIYVSATPGYFEKEKTAPKNITEQLIRPTGLLEPSIEIRPTKNQVKNLIEEIGKKIQKKQRVLVLTLTKKLAEAMSDYLSERKIKAKWLHAEIKTLERPQILKDLREGKYDVLVGINLLREGLDLPEVSMVAILDADKEGFLRTETTLIQTMGRAARHTEGEVILYADKITLSMKNAIKEISRRRKIQEEYNKKNNIVPKAITKEIKNWPFGAKNKNLIPEFRQIKDVDFLKKEMNFASKNLDFEKAAEIRDLIKKIKN